MKFCAFLLIGSIRFLWYLLPLQCFFFVSIIKIFCKQHSIFNYKCVFFYFLFAGRPTVIFFNFFSSCIRFLLVPNLDIACTMCIFIPNMVCFHCVFRIFVHQLQGYLKHHLFFILQQSWPTRDLRAACGSCFIVMRLFFTCFISSISCQVL